MFMQPFIPLRGISNHPGYKAGDQVVVFGELFDRGYANGFVHQALSKKMQVIGSTVGRRDAGQLRSLNSEELTLAKAKADFSAFINVALEAGFDMEIDPQTGKSPCDQLQGVKMSEWDQVKLDWEAIERSRLQGRKRFRDAVKKYVSELKEHLNPESNLIFAHTMAGGVPRAKILMPTMNKVFKGRGDRFISSEYFWKSDLGRLCETSFDEVTAMTLQVLIEETESLRKSWESSGKQVRYVAYGYHGTEIFYDGKYQWQTYSPYVQGWAKMHLEQIAREAWKQGVKATVFNCPEILTNSSSIFQGVEVPLYPLLRAIEKEGKGNEKSQQMLKEAAAHMKDEFSLKDIYETSDKFFLSSVFAEYNFYEKWPQHSGKEQMDLMMTASERLVEIQREDKETMTLWLSREIFDSTGYCMWAESWHPMGPVLWLGHDILAKRIVGQLT